MELEEFLLKLPKGNLVSLMYQALDEMQGYNGKSRNFCVLKSLGAKKKEQEDGTYKWTMPSLVEAKRNPWIILFCIVKLRDI